MISGQDRTRIPTGYNDLVVASVESYCKIQMSLLFLSGSEDSSKELNKSRYECTRDSKEHLHLGWTKISRRQRCRCVIGRPIATGRPLSIPATEFLLLRPPMISSSLLWMASPDTMGLPSLRHPYHYDHGVVDGGQGEQIIMGCTSKNTDRRRLPKSMARRQSHG